jgi:hypothetical protein
LLSARMSVKIQLTRPNVADGFLERPDSVARCTRVPERIAK